MTKPEPKEPEKVTRLDEKRQEKLNKSATENVLGYGRFLKSLMGE